MLQLTSANMIFGVKNLFEKLEKRPNKVFLIQDGEKVNLTNAKRFKFFGINCFNCNIGGKYFISFKEGDLKLYALNNFGTDVELFIEKKKTICYTCKYLRDSKLNNN